MAAEIIKDNDVTWPAFGDEYFDDILKKTRAIDRPIDNEGSDNPIVPQTGDEGRCSPAAIGNYIGAMLLDRCQCLFLSVILLAFK
jgi:hypothetical protein